MQLHEPPNLNEREEISYFTQTLAMLQEQAHAQTHHMQACIYGCLAILWSIHQRLSCLRRHGHLNHEGTGLLQQIEGRLQQHHADRWYDVMHDAH